MTMQNIKSESEKWLKEAGNLILEMSAQGTQNISSHLKADATPVTEIDHAVEVHLRNAIMQAYPDHGIIGEELPSHQPHQRQLWFIDPIDGTRALMAGFASYTILLALTENKKPRYGAIYQPITQEFWWGDIAHNSASLNNKTIHTRQCKTLANAFFSTTSPLLFREDDKPRILSLIQRCKAYQFGGDGYAYAKLASGNIDLIIESGLKPYDFMALIPVIEGAGGVITDWQGNPLSLDSTGDICAAGDATLHQQALAILAEK